MVERNSANKRMDTQTHVAQQPQSQISRKKVITKMSTSVTNPAATLPTQGEEIVVKRRAFDLNTFERTTLEGKVFFQPVTTLDEALSRVGGSHEELLKALNSGFRSSVKKVAKSELQSSDPNILGNAGVIMKFAAAFRMIPPYSQIKDRKEQTKAIFTMIRSQDSLMNSLRLAAQEAAVEDDDDDTDES